MPDSVHATPRRCSIDLPDSAGKMAAVEFGPSDRPLDVLFLHANGFNGMTYRQIFAPADFGLRVLAVDQRGHGRTTLPTAADDHSWLRYADDLLAVLAALPARPRVLAGHSMGATAILLASAHMAAESAPRMVLFDPVLRLPEEVPDATTMSESALVRGAKRRNALFASRQAALDSYRGRGAFKSWPDAMIEDYLADGVYRQDDGQFKLSCSPDWEAANFATSYLHSALPALTHPPSQIRILRAAHQSTCALGPDSVAWQGQPRVSLETVPGTTHFLPMELPELVRGALHAAVPDAIRR